MMQQMPKWITETVKELERREAFGKVTLHMEKGVVTRLNVEQSIRSPEKNKPKK